MTEKLKSRQTSTHTEYRVQKAFITQIETEKRLNIDSLKAIMRRKVSRSQSKISLHVASVKSLRQKYEVKISFRFTFGVEKLTAKRKRKI